MKRFFFFLLCMASGIVSMAQKDTLRVMAYNVLYYGNGCQGPNGNYHNYMKKIVSYANPDIFSMEKMAAIPVSHGDKYATAPYGFADSILEFALNAAFPGRYAYCPFTNNARGNNMAVLFYDKQKLGFVSIVSSYANITDFNTYKLYYKDPNLSSTHDTTFLYVLPTHDLSGDENEQARGAQIAEETRLTKQHFRRLPNMINMGDFNSRNSDEPFYQTLTAGADSNFRFSDPPFYPDSNLFYPANWDHNGAFSAYMTTSTRESKEIPNTCGTGGGAKGWYDHIFLSPWIINNTNYIRYIPNSYRTIGNDGKRFKVSINDQNTSAPADVIEALYQMSNKYPVMVSLEVTSNTTGISPADPEIPGVKVFVKEEASITNPVGDKMILHFPGDMNGQEITIACFDQAGGKQSEKTEMVKSEVMELRCNLKPGEYSIKITGHHNIILDTKFVKN